MSGLLENVGNFVSEKGRQVTNKASDLTELASIKNEISSLEKTIKTQYEAIGRLYYDIDGKDPREYFKVRCECISDTKKRISELENLAEGIKNRYTFDAQSERTQENVAEEQEIAE